MLHDIETINGRRFERLSFSSPQEMLAFVRADSKARKEAQRLVRDNGETWAGLGAQPLTEFFSSGFSTHAIGLFEKALAKLEGEKLLGRGQAPTVAGGAWVMPLVVQNHPMAARRVTREKLAPKFLKVRLGTSGHIPAEALSEPSARIARALWDYQLKGGVVGLSLWQAASFYGGANSPCYGFRVDCQVPLSSDAAVSTALSVALYRTCYIAIGQGYFEAGGISSLAVPSPADVLWLDGKAPNMDAALKKAGIQ